MVRRLAAFLRPYRLWVAAVLVLSFTQAMSSLYLPNLMSDIVDHGVLRGDTAYILRIGLWMFAVTLAGGLAAVGASFGAARVMAAFARDLRRRVFGHVERFSVGEFDRLGTSSLIVRTTNDVMQVQQLVNMSMRMLVMAPLTAVGGIVLAVRTDARLSLLIVVALPVMALTIYVAMGRGLGLFRAIQGKVDRLNRVLRENLTGVRVIRAFAQAAREQQRFRQTNADVTQTSIAVFQLMAVTMPAIMLIMNLTTVGIVWFGAQQIGGGTLQIGQLMAFIQYVTQIMFSVMMVSMLLFLLPRGEASAQRILEVLDQVPLITDPQQPSASPLTEAGRIEFDHVSFQYPGAAEPALHDLSFRVEPGQTIAILGGTGAGKTTLLELVLRLHDCTEGAVRVGGVDVRHLPQAELRKHIAYVPQQTVLFAGTIADNVRYGHPEASDEEVRRALALAQATEFVDALPQGIHSPLEQGGQSLSGGQRQRLAIARALVRPASIYLFDDSFSALDYRTESRLRAALRTALRSATVVVVAQRVSTVRDADRILVLDDGHLVGSGTHRELLQTCAVYREIVASQALPEEVA